MSWRTKAVLALAGLAFIGLLVIFGHEPSSSRERDTCPALGIDPESMKEGTCEADGTKTVVVDRGHAVRLKTLDARLLGVRQSRTIGGPGGTRLAKGAFLTFDLAITNRTDAPALVGESQVLLRVPESYGEDVGAEEGDPRSFLAARRPIAPGATGRGTVIFRVYGKAPRAMRHEGNLDFANFGTGAGDYEPEAVLEGSEVGVIRTYRRPSLE